MLIVSVVSTALGSGTTTAKLMLDVFFCLWGACFSSLVGVSIWTTTPELHLIRLRTYSQAFSTTCYVIFGLAASFYAPYMVNA
jgi:SP family sugar:H+ symporter-like MFS transporter